MSTVRGLGENQRLVEVVCASAANKAGRGSGVSYWRPHRINNVDFKGGCDAKRSVSIEYFGAVGGLGFNRLWRWWRWPQYSGSLYANALAVNVLNQSKWQQGVMRQLAQVQPGRVQALADYRYDSARWQPDGLSGRQRSHSVALGAAKRWGPFTQYHPDRLGRTLWQQPRQC